MDSDVVRTVVTKRTGTETASVLQTDIGQPDIHVKPLSPWKIVGIRTARVFVQTLAGSITVSTFSSLMSLKTAFIVAASTAGVTALQNTAELLAKLDQSYPEFRG